MAEKAPSGMWGRLGTWSGPATSRFYQKQGSIDLERGLKWPSKFKQQLHYGPDAVFAPVSHKTVKADKTMAVPRVSQKKYDAYMRAQAYADEVDMRRRLKEGIALDQADIEELKNTKPWGLRL